MLTVDTVTRERYYRRMSVDGTVAFEDATQKLANHAVGYLGRERAETKDGMIPERYQRRLITGQPDSAAI